MVHTIADETLTNGFPISHLPKRLLLALSCVLLVPAIGVGWVFFEFFSGSYNWKEVCTLFGFLSLSLMGSGLGHHRYFSHKTFKARRGLKIFLGILGSAAGVGQICWFSAVHRRHHRFTDTEKDPHTPHGSKNEGLVYVLKKTWMSAFGFSFRYALHGYHLMRPDQDRTGCTKEFRESVQDLAGDYDIREIDRFYYAWIFLFFLLPAIFLFLVTGQVVEFWRGMVWGGVARMGINQMIFGFINVLGHLKGPKSFASGDGSTNLYWFALFSNGESLHNNHHAFPWTAKTGLAWWQLDLNFYYLLLFEKLGWATEVRVPSAVEIQKKTALAARPKVGSRRQLGVLRK